MQQYLRDQVDWPQAFPAEEYAERRRRVREALAAADIDAIFVTLPADLTYLTGYDMIWFHLRNLTGVLVRADADETVFFDSVGHTTIVSTTPEIGEIVWFDHFGIDESVKLIADELAGRGLRGKRIALQRWGHAPHADVMDALAVALKSTGMSVTDASFLVEGVRLIKSPREIAVVRQAAAMADAAMAAARDAIRPGVTETALEGVIMGSLMAAGGGYPGIRTMLGSGPRAGTHHSAPTHRQVRQGELVFIDFCAALHRYHVNLNRTFSLGEPDPRWVTLMDTSAGCIDAIVEVIGPGDTMFKVHQVADDYVDANGLRSTMWYNGGYTLGIAFAPDWVGVHRTHPTPDTPDDRPLETGMVFNLENQFDIWEDWPGGSGAAYIETFLMTDTGLEVLSTLPRNLVVI